MSRILPPPPDPRDNRAFRDWLYKVYAVINGLDPSANMTGAEDSPLVAGVAELRCCCANGGRCANAGDAV